MKNYRLKNYLKIGMLLFVVSIFLWNCQKEDIANPLSLYQQNKEIQSIQQKFTLENYQDSFIKNNLKVDWNNFVYSNNMNVEVIKSNLDNPNNNLADDNFVTFEFSTNLNSKVSSIKDTTYFYSKKSLLASIDKRNNSITLKIINYSSCKNKDLEHINLNSLKNFNGTMTLFDLKGKSLKVDAYNSGELVESLKIPNNDKNLGHMAPPIGGTLIPVFIEHWRDIYQNLGGGSKYFYYINSHYEGTTVEYVYANTGFTSYGTYHGHFDDPHGPPNHPDNHPLEITMDPSVTPCVNTIIENLQKKDKNLSVVPTVTDEGNSHLVESILNLFNASKEYSLNFSIKQLGLDTNGNEINASTSPLNSGKGWNITIDVDLANNGTQLFIAKSIIHEAVHAYINYELKTDRTSDMVADLNSLYQNYKNLPNASNLTQHEFMSQFVYAFADSLAAWDNHLQSMDYYKMLSWGGLESSNAYSLLPNKSEIQNTIQNERYNKKNAKGSKCN